jgi:hypothetical protein
MKRKLKDTEDSEEIVESEANSKKVKNDGKICNFSKHLVLIQYLTEPDEEPDDPEPNDISVNFDIKKFRQNLKVGNFYDGEFLIFLTCCLTYIHFF